ncbi:alpha/beta hydrolase [Phenylobacterium sp. LjRoot225]|uniref:alpha/beta hydrolase n=1 Tax=Phenylobacterium sp. LjRoot225 TaxID=3342285 RepID=UPI003ECC5206
MEDDQARTGDPLAIAEDGTVSVAPFELPVSAALSRESRASWAAMLNSPLRIDIPDAKAFATDAEFQSAVDAFRTTIDEGMARPASERLLQTFPVNIAPDRIGGVPVEVFTPQAGMDEDRVLINLHGGAFFAGATHVARMEAIPLAYKGKFRVVSVDYRQGYEHRFPAASEDVAAVYAEMLKDYAPSQVGICGASAGGMLTSQATAWILEHGLPAPGAIGVFSAGTGGSGDGDYFSAIGSGKHPPDDVMSSITTASFGYFAETRADDYLVNPNIAPAAFRARFPPTLLITATRAFDLSPALATHRALAQAGVEASLHVFDGLGHSFFYGAATPEAVDAYDTIIRFFRRHLSR